MTGATLLDAPAWAAALLETERSAHLGLLDGDGRPRVLPVTFARVGDAVWSAVDDKPKRRPGEQLARVRRLGARPGGALAARAPGGGADRRPLRRRLDAAGLDPAAGRRRGPGDRGPRRRARRAGGALPGLPRAAAAGAAAAARPAARALVAGSGEPGQHLAPVGVEERLVVAADLLDIKLVHAGVGELLERLHVTAEVRAARHGLADHLVRDQLRGLHEVRGRGQHLGQLAGQRVVGPDA